MGKGHRHVEALHRRRPVDATGRIVKIGDRVISTESYDDKATWTGKVVGRVRENLIEVEFDQPRDVKVWRSAAFLWRVVDP